MSSLNSNDLQQLTNKVLAGYSVSKQDALLLAEYPDLDELCDCANKITRKLCGNRVDSCSIVNARSGMCGEDCKWCAQATRHHSDCLVYNHIDEEEVMRAAAMNQQQGIQRFSLVTSGRRVSDKDMPIFLNMYKRLAKETDLYLCASMGLLSDRQMQELVNCGVKRYHCNLETCEEFFPTLCTSHTPADKKAAIRAARRAGMQVCSGGIIGMGESMEQRISLALELRELDVDSVPVNILNPIKGTPLESTPLIGEDEVIRTMAIFRFILPDKTIRFAGGRARMSQASNERMLTGGVNGILMGDMLTSVGNSVAEDKATVCKLGLSI
ncbi:MAG: biotin synthase BioB [Prevotella sp.]|nr:biotin synthase BioB [Prevotella sp.]MCM1075426.1 biotin synthase BioB [Ruminococcus sp.]